MAKKIFLTTMFAVLFILALTTIGFAESSNMTTKLGNEVTSSMNKTEKGMDDLDRNNGLDEAGQALKDGVRETGNAIRNGMEDIKNGVEDLGDEEDNSRTTENRAVAGTTGNYTTGEIQTQTVGENRNGMTSNAWIWIVMVVVALIIIAAVWYYATQQK